MSYIPSGSKWIYIGEEDKAFQGQGFTLISRLHLSGTSVLISDYNDNSTSGGMIWTGVDELFERDFIPMEEEIQV